MTDPSLQSADPAAEAWALAVPLVVDLDGTLLRTDLLQEAAVGLATRRPIAFLGVVANSWRSKAGLKRELHGRVAIDPESLPYREPVLQHIQEARDAGRRIVLATAADSIPARAVADHLGVFDDVLASDGVTNCKGEAKLTAICELLGNDTFEYIGDTDCDLVLWQASKRATMVNPSAALKRRATEATETQTVLHDPGEGWPALLCAMRPAQWAKNALLAVPMLVGHAVTLAHLGQFLIAATCFCMAASSVYLVNDLVDIQSDRSHPSKRRRPIAAGYVSIKSALIASAVLLLASLIMAGAVIGLSFAGIVLGYIAASSAYSLFIKKIVLVDVVWLAGLYTLRIVAGGVAVSVFPSPWLLAFSLFFFLGLAFAKRYTELVRMDELHRDRSAGRGYCVQDIDLLRVMGPACGCMAVLVMGLYITSDAVVLLYRSPAFLWFIVPLLFYWVSRIWLIAMRGQLDDDPVVFALRDRVTYLTGVLMIVFILLAQWGPALS